MSDRPLVDVIVVPYECRELLRRCLRSLAAYPPTAGEMAVHVVDNASGDGTAEMVETEFPSVDLTVLPVNAGFSVANNVALRRSRARYALLLNPDTEVTAGAIDHMLEVMEARPEVGMSGCRLVRPDGTFDHAAKRRFPTPVTALAHFAGLGRRSDSGALGGYRAPEVDEHGCGEVDAVNGAFMLVRREALLDVGLLDEGYWLYMEDLDWCYRFHRRGWKVWYEGAATVVHVKGGTSGRRRAARQNIAFHRGMGRFYRRHQADGRPLLAAAVYAGILVKLGVSLARNEIARRGAR